MPAALGAALLLAAAAASAPLPAESADDVRLLATISTQNGTSPAFDCSAAAAGLDFRPLAATHAAVRSLGGGKCQLTGASAVGEYVMTTDYSHWGTARRIVKAIDLARPVRNLGGSTIFAESWAAEFAGVDGDSESNVWQSSGGAVAASGTLSLPPGGALTMTPREARTLSFFRHPLTVTVEDVRAAGASARIALEVPSAAARASTGWPRARHYLPLEPVPARLREREDSSPGPAGLAAILHGGQVQLLERRTANGSAVVLGSGTLGTACSSARVELFAGSVFTMALRKGYGNAPPLRAALKVFCGAELAVNISAVLGLDFHDKDGFGDSVGEAVLSLSAETVSDDAAAVTMGAVSVRNNLPPLSSPAVLAPITDQLGTLNWDHGELGIWHDVAEPAGCWTCPDRHSVPPFGPKEGVLDVSKPPFSADPTGQADATQALQAALEFSRHNYLALWLPVGQYKVTNTLRMAQQPRMASLGFAQFNDTSNYCWSRFTTWALRGQVLRADDDSPAAEYPRPGRATLVVPPNTKAFALDEANASATPPLAVLNASDINAADKLQPNILMSAIIQSVDIVIGEGNPAAVGVRMRGAQGSSIEDVAVFAAHDAFAGISGCSGSGGAHSNLTVIGARVGIDARDTQPSATLSNLRLYNQSCVALLHEGYETLTIAGAHVVVGSSAEPSAAAFVSGAPDQLPPLAGQCAQLLAPATDGQPASDAVAGALSVIDAGFECQGCRKTTAIATTRNLYLRRVAVNGLAQVSRSYEVKHIDERPWFELAVRYELKAAASGSNVHELSVPVPFGWSNYLHKDQFSSTAYINGQPVVTSGAAVLNTTALSSSPDWDAMCDRHSWGDNHNSAFPGHHSHNAINVKDARYAAVGDGVTDDTASLQRAIDDANRTGAPVFIPRGAFRTSRTLVVPAGVQLVGLARHLTTIVSDDTAFSFADSKKKRDAGKDLLGEPDYSSTPPILSFESASGRAGSSQPGVSTVFFGMTLVIPVWNNHTATSAWHFNSGAAPGSWNVARQFWSTRIPMCGQWWSERCADRFYHHPAYESAYAVIAGAEASLRVFVLFQEDGQRNGGYVSQSPFSRHAVVVNGTRQEVSFYQLNGEHGIGTAYSEFVDTVGVSVFGHKSEMTGAALFVRNSRQFSSYGHGGPAAQGAATLAAAQCDGMDPCPWEPSLYRIVDSEDVRFVNLQGQGYSKDNKMMFELHGRERFLSPNGSWPSIYFRSPA